VTLGNQTHATAGGRGNSVLGRSLWSRVVDTSGQTHYATERHLDGWFIVTAEGGDVYVNPFGGAIEWDYLVEGIFIPQNTSRVLFLSDDDLGCYCAKGSARLEAIEPVAGVEFAGPIQGSAVVPTR
jgi:hypothetical protein